MIPKEHGGWAMLLVPLFTGGILGGDAGLPLTLFLMASLGFFLARYPLSLLAGRARKGDGRRRTAVIWLAAYGTAGVLFALPLLLLYGRWLLVPLGLLSLAFLALHLYLERERLERTVAGELAGIAGLVLSAPAAYYVARGVLDGDALLLWLLNFLYFGGSVFYVKMRVAERTGTPGRRPYWRIATAAYHLLLLAVVGMLVLGGLVSRAIPLAYVPVVSKALAGAWRPPALPSIKSLGFLEVGHSLLFAFLLVVTFRLVP